MAGEPLSLTELQGWYNAFNNIINNYSGGTITALTAPTEGAKALPSNINNLYGKINEFVNETYLGTQPSLYDTDYTIVSQGETITRTDATPIINTVANLSQIKCRNMSSYSHTTKSHGCNQTYYSYWGRTTHTASGDNWVMSYNSQGSNGVNDKTSKGTTYTQSIKGVNTSYTTKSHTKNTHGGAIDILNSLATK